MVVKRIVANIQSSDPAIAIAFYQDVLGMRVVMDQGWIITFSGEQVAPAQFSVAVDGGSGTPLPDLSIEVDDLQEVIDRLRAANVPLEYGPAVEPWGVRRLYVRDPFRKLLNILQHIRT